MTKSQSAALYLYPSDAYWADWYYDPFFVRLLNWKSSVTKSRWSDFFKQVHYPRTRNNNDYLDDTDSTKAEAGSFLDSTESLPSLCSPEPCFMMTPGYAAYDRWARANKDGDLLDANPFFKLPYDYSMVVTPQSLLADSYSDTDTDTDTSTEDDDLSELDDTLTWDPTIWAPRDPADFHPPGLEGVVEKRKYWGGRTIPPKRAQLVPRSTYPWWFRMYVWRIIGNGAVSKKFKPFHGFFYAGEREIMRSEWRLFV